MKKNICIIYTGGTIGMKKKKGSFLPGPDGYLTEVWKQMPEFNHVNMPQCEIIEHSPIIDSANMTPHDWVRIASCVAENYHKYDGFIILHGTDTMAYTASALAFMLRNLSKPVILTGAQIPLSELRSDGKDNIVAAAIIAQNFNIPEVCLYFGNKLYRGCRSVKLNASGFDAFFSPNLSPLTTAGIDIDIREDLILKAPKSGNVFEFIPFNCEMMIASVRIFPGISAQLIAKILEPPIRGLVLEAYGVGNIPDNPELAMVLENAVKNGIVVVVCSQCLLGEISLDYYKGGSILQKCGVINGHDMTVEATIAKMMYLFTLNKNLDEMRILMEKNLRGELKGELYSTML